MKSQICWCKYFFDFCWCGCINKIFGNVLQNRFFSIFDQNLSKINKIWGVTVSRAWSSYVNPFIWWVCHIHSTFWWFSEKSQKSRNFQKSQYLPIHPLLLLRIDFLKKYVEYAHMRWDLGFSARIDVSKIFVCKNMRFERIKIFRIFWKIWDFYWNNAVILRSCWCKLKMWLHWSPAWYDCAESILWPKLHLQLTWFAKIWLQTSYDGLQTQIFLIF